jgi:hypothetical protein
MQLHACFAIGHTEVMASDGMCSGRPEFKGVALSLSVPDAATARTGDRAGMPQRAIPLGRRGARHRAATTRATT